MGHLEIYRSCMQSVDNWIWEGGGAVQVIAAFSYKPFCVIRISKIICMSYFDKLIKILIFQNK